MLYHRPLLIILLAIAASLAVAGYFITQSLTSEEKYRSQVQSTLGFLSDLRRLEASLLDAETGQRGYILTSDPEYLDPYDEGLERYPEAIAALRARLPDDVSQEKVNALNNLEILGNQKLAELARTISLFDTGQRQESLALIQSNEGRDYMVNIRELAAKLEVEEQLKLDTTIARARTAQNQTITVLAISAGLILALLAALAVTYYRSEKLNRTEELLSEVTLHRDRSLLLSKELSHRTKNLFGIVSSIVRMTGRGETDTKLLVEKVSARIGALSRAHSLTAEDDIHAGIELPSLVQVTLEPYADDGRTLLVDGERILVGSETLTPLGLILHELATNAVKYGAWSSPKGGIIEVSWKKLESTGTVDSQELVINWVEEATDKETEAPLLAENTISSGFGSRMIEMSVQQLGGTIKRNWNGGLSVELSLRLPTRQMT